MKKYLSLCLTVVMLVSVLAGAFSFPASAEYLDTWDGTYPDAYVFAGSGTGSDPYLIDSAAALAYLSASTNGGNAWTGTCFRLTVDVDMADHPWTGIGAMTATTGTTVFSGVFDGGHHKILNFALADKNADGVIYNVNGFFGEIQNATVRNLGIHSGAISVSGARVGAVVGYACGTNTVENCYNLVDISVVAGNTTQSNVGGICGVTTDANTTRVFTNCYNAGNITISLKNNQQFRDGGIIGSSTGATLYLTNCVNVGNVTVIEAGNTAGSQKSDNRSVGGVVGASMDAPILVRCMNSGTVSYSGPAQLVYASTAGGYYVGSLIGRFGGNSNTSFTNGAKENVGVLNDGQMAVLVGSVSNTTGTTTNYKWISVAETITPRFVFGYFLAFDGESLTTLAGGAPAIFMQMTAPDSENKQKVRLLICAEEQYLEEITDITVTITFTMGDLSTRTATLPMSQIVAYRAVYAANQLCFAAEGCVLIGAVVTDVPVGEWTSVAIATSVQGSAEAIFAYSVDGSINNV